MYITGMLRIARIDTLGLLHHVMIRGIERRKIFMDILSESEEQFSWKCKLKSLGYVFEKVVERVSILFQMKKDYTGDILWEQARTSPVSIAYVFFGFTPRARSEWACIPRLFN